MGNHIPFMNKIDTQGYSNIGHLCKGYSILRISSAEDHPYIIVQLHNESGQCPRDVYVKFLNCSNLNVRVKSIEKDYAPMLLADIQIVRNNKGMKHIKVTLQDFQGVISFDCEQICKQKDT